VLDQNQRFAEAATRYFEISNKSSLSAEEKSRVLQNALVCTVLATRGQQKNQMLMNLFKDDRAAKLVGYPIIQEMYFERFIKPEQVISSFLIKVAFKKVLHKIFFHFSDISKFLCFLRHSLIFFVLARRAPCHSQASPTKVN
jgi:hypothetical protein